MSNLSNLLQYAIRGIPIGCVFALLAVGLTLNYKTSGVFNLAFAAQAYASAALFYVLRREHSWPLAPAAFLAVVVLGAAMAWVLDRFLYRHQRTATPLAKLVTSLGLLVAIPQIVQLIIGNGNQGGPAAAVAGAATASTSCGPSRGQYVLDASQIATILCTIAVVVFLVVLFRRGALGPAHAGGGGEPAAARSSRASTPSGWRCRRGSWRACWPAWPACSSLPCSPSSTRPTSSPCWWRPSPPAWWAT